MFDLEKARKILAKAQCDDAETEACFLCMDELEEALAELASLRETVAKVAMTADGVAIVLGQTEVFYASRDSGVVYALTVGDYEHRGKLYASIDNKKAGTTNFLPLSTCYSTEAAARAVKDKP